MSTGSIRHNIEITDSADAERFVEALEKAKAESEDMERLTEIKTHVTGFSYTDKKEGIFAQNVYAKLAAYEDTGLTPEQIQEQQRYIKALEKQVEVEGQQAIIEAQQQEIDRLKEKLNAVLQDFYQYVQGGKEICAFCLHDYECEPGETICGATYKGFKWKGICPEFEKGKPPKETEKEGEVEK